MTATQEQQGAKGFVPHYRALVIEAHREQLISYLVIEFGFTPRVAANMIDQLPELLADDFRVVAPASEHHLAERSVDGFFAYLLIARTASGFVPSKHIDWVWEQCMVRSHTFWALCEVIVGRYVHHLPWDEKVFGQIDRDEARRLGLEATRAAVAQIGPVDDAVFTAIALNGCNLCASDETDQSGGKRVAALADEQDQPPGPDGSEQYHNLCYATAGARGPASVLTIRVGPDQRLAQLIDA